MKEPSDGYVKFVVFLIFLGVLLFFLIFPDYKSRYNDLQEKYDDLSINYEALQDDYKDLESKYDYCHGSIVSEYDNCLIVYFYLYGDEEITLDEAKDAASAIHDMFDKVQ